MASNQVYWVAAMPSTATAISRNSCPRAPLGGKTANSRTPPAASRTPTSQAGSMSWWENSSCAEMPPMAHNAAAAAASVSPVRRSCTPSPPYLLTYVYLGGSALRLVLAVATRAELDPADDADDDQQQHQRGEQDMDRGADDDQGDDGGYDQGNNRKHGDRVSLLSGVVAGTPRLPRPAAPVDRDHP